MPGPSGNNGALAAAAPAVLVVSWAVVAAWSPGPEVGAELAGAGAGGRAGSGGGANGWAGGGIWAACDGGVAVMPADGKWLDALDEYGTADETPGYVPGEKSDGTGFHPPKRAGPSGS